MKTNQTKRNGTSMFNVRGWMLDVALTLLLLSCASASAATRYVWQSSPSPAPPYTNWATAAHVIQDAVDAALAGDEIVVTNGAYATGGRAVGTNVSVNRVAVDKPLTVRSVNGPQFTIIQGYQVPGTTNGDGAIRCVYLTSGASLSGFTLTNGATRSDGDWQREQVGGGVWCESESAVVSNCAVVGNSAAAGGGGAYGGTLNNCTLTGNSAEYGGGAFEATLNNCTLTGNSAGRDGGGAYRSTLNNCTLTGNSAFYGGGVAGWFTKLHNCLLTGNSAARYGGAAYGGFIEFNNCTITGNSALGVGGGATAGGDFGQVTLNNCIIYYNTAPESPNAGGELLNYCCTTPEPRSGIGNITLEPQLASAGYLSVGSPCRGAGSAAYATGTDLDGEPWATAPSIGCDEYSAGAMTGPLSVSIVALVTNVAAGWPAALAALIEGLTTASVWEFGDGVVVSNQPFATHAWAVTNDYLVTVRAYNESHPAGVSATLTVHVLPQPTHYVSVGSANPLSPYISWATAATNIQDAVDAATLPGALVLVTNGAYASGGRVEYGTLTSRVTVDKQLVLRSVNGPEFTLIEGRPGTTNFDGAIRCVSLMNDVSLSGFTLTNGGARLGGGVYCGFEAAVISNCVVSGNAASFGGGAFQGLLRNCTLTGNSAESGGGGAYFCTLYNCTLTGNSTAVVHGYGGGAYWSTLDNCTLTGNSAGAGGGGAGGGVLYNCSLVGNSAGWGGGSDDATLNNCIVYFNSAPNEANYDSGSILNYCCTTTQPTNGVGNITNAPLFVDYAAGNLRLQSNSPCINAGRNAYAPGPTDLDGLPRIVSGTVDIGAYEFQGPGSVLSYAWLQNYGLPTDGSADATDPDADGHTTWQEWRCLTDPTNALSVLRLLSASRVDTNVTVRWQSVAGVNYFLERSPNLSATPVFTPLAIGIPGQPGTTIYTDTNAVGVGAFFYRAGVGQ